MEAELELRRRKKKRASQARTTIEDWKKDFLKFTSYLKVPPVKGGLPIPLKPTAITGKFEKNRTGRDIILKSRQVFMTTWELARDIWFFLCHEGVTVVILCPSSNDNAVIKQLSHRLEIMFESLKEKFPDVPYTKISETKWARTDNANSHLQIIGAGATQAAAAKKGRSGTIHRLHVTEVAFFEFADVTITAINPCIPAFEPGNEVVFETTPQGAAGYFFKIYHQAAKKETEYTAHFFPWFEQAEYRLPLKPGEIIAPQNKREREMVEIHKATPEQLKWYRYKVKDQGQAKIDQEFPSDEETCWLFDGRMFFDKEVLSKLRLDAVEPVQMHLGGALKIWHPIEPSSQYILSADPSNGVGADPMAAYVFEKGTGRLCASLHGQFTPDAFAVHLATLGWIYNQALIVFERSASYALIYKTLQEWKRPNEDTRGYPRIYFGQDKQPGFNMNPISRPAVLDNLEAATRSGAFNPPDIEWVKEALTFVVNDNKPEAAKGAHDDRIICSAIGWFLLSIPSGLKHTDFGGVPSIAYGNVPASFEGMVAFDRPSIDQIVQNEQKKWAGANTGDGGFSSPIIGLGDLEGF